MIILFLLVSARVTGLFIGAPLLSRPGIPRRFKAMLIFFLSALLLPGALVSKVPGEAVAVAGAMVGEVVIGMTIGFSARLLLAAFQMAGSMIAFQMGFGMARTFDPESGTSTPVIGSLYLNLATLIFLLIDGHHFLIHSLAVSFQAFPVAAPAHIAALTASIFSSAGEMFELGARIAGPVTGLLLLTNAIVGFINRVVPQLSIFNIGFPMTVMGGLLAVTVALPEVASFLIEAYSGFEARIVAMVGA